MGSSRPRGATSASCTGLVGLVLALAACTDAQPRGEYTRTQCTNLVDDDDDDMADCEDVDCQIYDHCRLGTDTAGEPAATGGSGGTPPPSTPDAGPPPLLVDGGAVCPTVACPADRTCVAGVCIPKQLAVGDEWVITSIEAGVPRSANYSLADPMCIDDDCASPVSLPPFFLCGCLPDPLVRVSVDGVEIGQTEAAVNLDLARWDTAIPIVVLPTSELRFDVFDRDTLDDEFVYDCSVTTDPALLASGTVTCARNFPADAIEVPFGVTATVAVSTTP
jgi:hypothetical protein